MRIFEVCQVVQYLQDLLDADALLGDLWISGEVSNFGRSPAGHAYFTLKDAQSQLRCALFRSNVRGYVPGNGEAVIAHGRVSIYRPSGSLELIVDLVQPEGVGELHLKYELLRQRLEGEGLFDPDRKRPLPPFPRRIGLVTSPTGAVLQDIWQVIGQRYPYVELLLAPTPVQGDHAAPLIARAIGALSGEPALDL
ncbi:MAG TPA: exodeoxyribonuclease VII large subunit, partial [Dehalococcoidia bacterium]|nr:exodeoxyribonuclease VII large subunit [Dehalococcoidia bacterium]